MNLENLNSYCITIDDNVYNKLTNRFKKVGLPIPKKIYGPTPDKLPHEIIDEYQTKEFSLPTICCNCAHRQIIQLAKEMKYPYVTVFEDDAYPRKDVAEQLTNAFKVIPKDAGIILYGYNGIKGYKPENVVQINDYWYRLDPNVSGGIRTFGSHAYTIFENAYDMLLDNLYDKKIFYQDMALRINDFNKNLNTYFLKEYIFIQHSDNNRMNMTSNMNLYPRLYLDDYPTEFSTMTICKYVPSSENPNWVDLD